MCLLKSVHSIIGISHPSVYRNRLLFSDRELTQANLVGNSAVTTLREYHNQITVHDSTIILLD